MLQAGLKVCMPSQGPLCLCWSRAFVQHLQLDVKCHMNLPAECGCHALGDQTNTSRSYQSFMGERREPSLVIPHTSLEIFRWDMSCSCSLIEGRIKHAMVFGHQKHAGTTAFELGTWSRQSASALQQLLRAVHRDISSFCSFLVVVAGWP